MAQLTMWLHPPSFSMVAPHFGHSLVLADIQLDVSESSSHFLIHFLIKWHLRKKWRSYSGDLNGKPVWYSDHVDLFAHRIVCYSDASYHGSSIQWGSEIRPSLDFEWSERGWVANGLDFEWHLKSWSLTIWNPDKWTPFYQKPFEIRTKPSRFWMVWLSNGWD